MRWPQKTLRGEADALRAEKNKRNAVGPSEGNTNGCPVTMAIADSNATVIAELINTYAAMTARLLW